MRSLHIASTKYTPQVAFDPDTGVLELAGSSYPENAMEFFRPINAWLEEFVAATDKPIVVNLAFDYLNTTSSKCILDLLEIIGRYGRRSGRVAVNWQYDKNDEDMLECGKDYAEDSGLPFTMLPH